MHSSLLECLCETFKVDTKVLEGNFLLYKCACADVVAVLANTVQSGPLIQLILLPVKLHSSYL